MACASILSKTEGCYGSVVGQSSTIRAGSYGWDDGCLNLRICKTVSPLIFSVTTRKLPFCSYRSVHMAFSTLLELICLLNSVVSSKFSFRFVLIRFCSAWLSSKSLSEPPFIQSCNRLCSSLLTDPSRRSMVQAIFRWGSTIAAFIDISWWFVFSARGWSVFSRPFRKSSPVLLLKMLKNMGFQCTICS